MAKPTRRLFRTPAPLYLYYKPSGPTTYAVLHAFTELEVEVQTEENGNATGPFLPHGADPFGKDHRPGWILATNERVPIGKDEAGLYAWMKKITDYLPMYPSQPEGVTRG